MGRINPKYSPVSLMSEHKAGEGAGKLLHVHKITPLCAGLLLVFRRARISPFGKLV